METVIQREVENVAQPNTFDSPNLMVSPAVETSSPGPVDQTLTFSTESMVSNENLITSQPVESSTFTSTEVFTQSASDYISESVVSTVGQDDKVELFNVEGVDRPMETFTSLETPSTVESYTQSFVDSVVVQERDVGEEMITPEMIETSTVVPETVSEVVTELVTETQTVLSTSDDQSDDVSQNFASSISSQTSSATEVLLKHDYVQWLHETRLIFVLSVSMVYLFTIFLIRRLLTKRQPFQFRSLLTLWNLSLACFSVACSTLLGRHLISFAKENGLEATICSPVNNSTTLLWLNLFTWAKLIQLGNTLFTVLRKQQLQFFHIYYNLSTLIYTFYIFSGAQRMTNDDSVNSILAGYYQPLVFIHSATQAIGYIYYTLRSIRGYPMSKWIARSLYLIQMIQFTAILLILSFSLYHHIQPEGKPSWLSSSSSSSSSSSQTCSSSTSVDIFGLIVVITNFILAFNHLRSNYIQPKTIKLL